MVFILNLFLCGSDDDIFLFFCLLHLDLWSLGLFRLLLLVEGDDGLFLLLLLLILDFGLLRLLVVLFLSILGHLFFL